MLEDLGDIAKSIGKWLFVVATIAAAIVVAVVALVQIGRVAPRFVPHAFRPTVPVTSEWVLDERPTQRRSSAAASGSAR